MRTKKLWSSGQLELYDLTIEDSQFLLEHGFDIGDYGCVEIDEAYESRDGNIVIGYDEDYPFICTKQGIIIQEQYTTRFANTSLFSFYRSIIIFSEYYETIKGISGEEEELSIVNDTIAIMKEVDKQAWEKNDNYWPIIAQQMIEGNL